MAQKNEQNNRVNPESLPMKRKLSHTKDEVPVSEASLRNEKQIRADSSDSPGRSLNGQPVCGFVDGTFKDGYMLTIRVGIGGPVVKGFVFDPHRFPPPVGTDYAETSTRASVPEPSKRAIQTAVQPLSKDQPAAAQPIQQNATPSPTLFQHLQLNNKAGAQPLLRRGPTSHQPNQSVQQPVGVLQRNGHAPPTEVGLPVRQNYGVVQTIQRNQPDTTARSVQKSGRAIRSLPRYEHVGALPPSLHPVLMSSKTAQRIRRTAPSILTRGYWRAAAPYARNRFPNQDRHHLQSDSRPTNSRPATKAAASNADSIGTPAARSPRSQIDNSLTACTGGPVAAFTEGEGVLIITPSSKPTGYSSGNFSGNANSTNTPNADEILQGARGQLSEPRTPVVKSNTEPEDSCVGHSCNSAEATLQASTSHGDPKKCRICGKGLLDLNF